MSNTGIQKAQKYQSNPFVGDALIIDKGKKMAIVGTTKQILVNTETGDTEGITLLHKYKEVDKEQFVKLFTNEIQALFGLSKTGLKVFGYVINQLQPNTDQLYIYIPKVMEYCNYGHHKTVYRGLSELLANKIIAMSVMPHIWYVNPAIVFNGDRIAFVKEYRLKEKKKLPTQTEIFRQLEQARENNEQPKD